MRKMTLLLLAFFISIGCLSACQDDGGQKNSDNEKLQIITTIFPEYDWVVNVLGDNPAQAEVTLLLDNGVDLHSYQPSAADIMKIAQCDLFIYVGGESDEWVEDALAQSGNEKRVVLNLMEILGDRVREEEELEGMQAEEEHEHEHDEEETEYDEHVWLSLRNAQIIVEKISETLQKIDKAHADDYRENTAEYVYQLQALDEQYTSAIASAPLKTLLFADRYPFRYLADDYGLTCYAAFSGCSAESEASFETVAFLAKKVDELNLPVVLTIEGTNHRIAETVVSNTSRADQKILSLNSLQSITAADVKSGVGYLSIMEDNLSVIRQALNQGE